MDGYRNLSACTLIERGPGGSTAGRSSRRSWGTSVSGFAGDEVPGKRGAGELLAHQAGEEEHGAAWPVVHHYVLRLPGWVAGNRHNHAGRLAADLTGVVLEEAVVAVVAGEAELLVLIQLAGGDHD